MTIDEIVKAMDCKRIFFETEKLTLVYTKQCDLEPIRHNLQVTTDTMRQFEALAAERLKEIESLRADAERWRVMVAEADKNYVEIGTSRRPYWCRFECEEAITEFADEARKGGV